jgi:hypothetical protein
LCLDPLYRKPEGTPIGLLIKTNITVKNKYITSHFMEACQNPPFLYQWMTIETWINTITTHYNVPSKLKFTIKMHIEGIHQTTWHASILITTNQAMNMQVNTKNGIDLKNNQKQTLCFYFYVIIEVIRCKEVAFSIITADS